MSQIRYVGQPSDRVHRGASRASVKQARWGYVPRQKQPVTWIDVKQYLEVIAVTLALVVAFFFTWYFAGL